MPSSKKRKKTTSKQRRERTVDHVVNRVQHGGLDSMVRDRYLALALHARPGWSLESVEEADQWAYAPSVPEDWMPDFHPGGPTGIWVDEEGYAVSRAWAHEGEPEMLHFAERSELLAALPEIEAWQAPFETG